MEQDLYVNVDIARQLRSIGFNEACHMVWNIDTGEQELLVKPMTREQLVESTLLCPTKQQVIDWFIEKHGLFIQIEYERLDEQESGFFCTIKKIEEVDENGEVVSRVDNTLYDSRTAAIDRGIDMCIGIVFEHMAEISTLPATLEDAVKYLDKHLDEESKEYLMYKSAASCHHTVGRWIRNTFRLWDKDKSPLYNHLFEKGFLDPDEMSNYIIEEFQNKLKGSTEVPVDDYVPYDIVRKLVVKGFPARTVDEWYCAYDGGPDRDSPVTENHYPMVTQNRARKWLKRKYDIFIEVSLYDEEDRNLLNIGDNKYTWNIYRDSTGAIRPFNGNGVTECEAVNNAIEYCVDNLI